MTEIQPLASSPPPAKKPVNILMVDDQPAKLMSYEVVLADLGENLIRANSGNEALEFLLRTNIAVVLVDVCMPELNGFELASLIRSHPRFRKTAVILVSGVLVEDMDRLKGYDSGAVDYISVPIVPEILRAKVAVFADLYRKTEELERLNLELETRVAQRTAEITAAAARLRQSEERMRLVLTAAGIEGWTWDIARDEIAWVRPSGIAEPPWPAARFLDRLHPDDRAALRRAFRASAEAGFDYQVEYRTRARGDEPENWWLGRGTVIQEDDRPHSIAGININISQRKYAEEERARLLGHAEAARREAERANRLKDEFLATLSHELRTPLNAITGWSHLLLAGDLDDADRATAVQTIHRNALLQAQLIADLLDVSRIVSGKLRLDLSPLDLVAVVRTAIDSVRPLAEAKGTVVAADCPDRLDFPAGDATRLQQVVVNLLSNAIKFAPDEGLVRLALQCRDGAAELTVADNGPGIAPDFLPHIFERFRQADPSSTRAHKGLGLGLTIVRHLVELHGGVVTADNAPQGGALFTLRLPLPAAGEAACAPAAGHALDLHAGWRPARPDLKNLRVLVIDDEADGREIAARILERSGAEVIVAASATDALRILARERPDLIVADIEMPGEDGYSLVRHIRALPPAQGGATPALALTAYAGDLDRARLLQAGFQRHVAKPVNPAELVASLAAIAPLPPAAATPARASRSRRG